MRWWLGCSISSKRAQNIFPMHKRHYIVMKAQAQLIPIAHRWESPIAHTFFVGILMFLGVFGTAGRAFWATTLASDQAPLPLWTNLLLYSVGLVFFVLWIRSAVVAFRDVRTQFTMDGILRPMWLQQHVIVWSDIIKVTITPFSVMLTTSQTTYTMMFKSFRQPEQVLDTIRERVSSTTPIIDMRDA